MLGWSHSLEVPEVDLSASIYLGALDSKELSFARPEAPVGEISNYVLGNAVTVNLTKSWRMVG